MDARMEAAKAIVKGANNNLSWQWNVVHKEIRKTWQNSFSDFRSNRADRSQVLPPMFNPQSLADDFESLSRTPHWHQSQASSQRDEMNRRLRKELEDVEFRLEQGLEKCDEFWVDEDLLRYRHSRSKWLSIWTDQGDPATLRVAYSRALETRDDVIYVAFLGHKSHDDDDWIVDTIRRMPYLTSIFSPLPHLQSDTQRDIPLFTTDTDVVDFLNKLQFAEPHHTFIYMKIEGGFLDPAQFLITSSATIVISFFGPMSGNLTLRFRHRTSTPDVTLTIGDMTASHPFKFPFPITSTLTVDDITLRPHTAPSSRTGISFERGTRNNLIIRVQTPSMNDHYYLRDIQLLDERGSPYNLRSSETSDVSSSRSKDKVVHPAGPSFSEVHDDLLVPSTSK